MKTNKKRILNVVVSLLTFVVIFCMISISTYAYSYELPDGNVIDIPTGSIGNEEIFSMKVGLNADFGLDNMWNTNDSTFGSISFDNKYTDFYDTITGIIPIDQENGYYIGNGGPNFSRFKFPIIDSGTYHFSISISFFGESDEITDNLLITDGFHFLYGQNASNYQNLFTLDRDNFINSTWGVGCNFDNKAYMRSNHPYSDKYGEYSQGVMIKGDIDYDNKLVDFSLCDCEGKIIENVRCTFNTLDLDNEGKYFILRCGFETGTYISPYFNALVFHDFKIYGGNTVTFTEQHIQSLLPYLDQIKDSSLTYGVDVGYNNGYNIGYNSGKADGASGVKTYYNEYQYVLKEKNELQQLYNALEDSHAYCDESIIDMTERVERAEEELKVAEGVKNSALAQVNDLNNKIKNLEEGVENSNALLNLGSGIFDGAREFLTPILDLQLFGTDFTLGGLLAVLLGGAIVIIVIKLFI